MPLTAGQRLGVYEIVSPLGAGGMGEVFRARDTRLRREVALKVLPDSWAHDPSRLARFEQEARAASALNHPNILTIHDVGRESEVAFIAMELVDGKTLRDLQASGRLPVRRILNIAAQVAAGLAKAHEAGIVHRDLKPENVMVSKDGFVKILDFGLAKHGGFPSDQDSAMPTVARPDTRPGTILGTVAYMSPEQASAEPVDFRSDQFSFGLMLYELLTGRHAFQRKTAAETMSAIIRDEPDAVAQLRPDIPVPLRWALDRCLAKDREDRYASTRDLARDLASMRDHLSEVPSGTETAPAKGRTRHIWRRPIVALLLGLALIAVGLLAGWGLTRSVGPAQPRGASFQRLTFGQGDLANARFAPDGSVVYGARFGSYVTRLYRTRVGSPESERFEFPGDILAISPTTELVIIHSNDSRGVGMLARVPMAGGTPRDVLEHATYGGADFDPRTNELAVARAIDGRAPLEFPLGKVLVADGISRPRFSRDGASIAFWEDLGGSYAVSVIDRAGTSKRTLSTGWSRFQGAPCWSADGREVWFTASHPGEPETLWAVDLSGKRRLVTRVPGGLELDDVSREGQVLLAHHTITRTIRLASSPDPTPRELAWLDASFAADLSADGTTVLLNEQGEGSGSRAVVYMRRADGAPAVRLGEGAGRSLSPDGKWVLLADSAATAAAMSYSLLPTGPGQRRALDPGGLTDLTGGAWLPDGKSVVFSALDSSGGSRMYVQAVDGGTPRPIGPERMRILQAGAVSPDARFVVGIRGTEVLLVPIDGSGEARVVPGVTLPEDRVAQWTSDSRALYVYRVDERVFTVSQLDLQTGRQRPWREIPIVDINSGPYLLITPDGRSWAYSGARVQSALYLVEGLH